MSELYFTQGGVMPLIFYSHIKNRTRISRISYKSRNRYFDLACYWLKKPSFVHLAVNDSFSQSHSLVRIDESSCRGLVHLFKLREVTPSQNEKSTIYIYSITSISSFIGQITSSYVEFHSKHLLQDRVAEA